MKPGCLNCTERELNCHSTCHIYSQFTKLNEEIKKAKYLEMDADAVAIENVIRIKRAMSRR